MSTLIVQTVSIINHSRRELGATCPLFKPVVSIVYGFYAKELNQDRFLDLNLGALRTLGSTYLSNLLFALT